MDAGCERNEKQIAANLEHAKAVLKNVPKKEVAAIIRADRDDCMRSRVR
ncbi:MAG: hypothetical protein Q6373_020375 [Candidatus Sigynarchaeota archaeon]